MSGAGPPYGQPPATGMAKVGGLRAPHLCRGRTGGGYGWSVTWNAWVQRISGDLTALSDGDWLTFTLGADSAPVGASVADVLVQARPLEGVLALECIADTEFEGLTDLTPAQQSALVALGWEQDGDDPDFERTFAPDDTTAAAELVAATLRDVLGAGTPDQVDVRRRDLG